MSDKTLRNVLFGMLMTGGVALTGCSDRTEGNENDGAQQPQTEQQATPQRQVQNDPYGNVALFEASRSKIKFALAFVENYYPYIYWCGEAWTTGHGLTILYNADGSSKKVTQNTPIPTLEQSDVYKGRYLTHEILPDIKSCIKVPMDENTMIAACVLRYCLGHKNFATSEFVKQCNAGKKGAELAKTLTGWRQQPGVINRCYFFAALMAGEIQYSDLLDLRAEGCYNLTWQDMLVYSNGNPKTDSKGFCTWDFSKIQANLQKAKNPRTVSLNLGRKKGHVRVACKKVNEIVPDYIWQEVSNGRAQPVVTTPSQSNDTANFADAWASYSCDELNDVSYIAYLKQDYETALEAGKAALKVAKTNKQRGAATYNIGITYFAMEKYEKAVHYLRLSLAENRVKVTEDALQQAIQKRNQRRTNYGIGTGLVLGLGAIGFRRIKKGRSK